MWLLSDYDEPYFDFRRVTVLCRCWPSRHSYVSRTTTSRTLTSTVCRAAVLHLMTWTGTPSVARRSWTVPNTLWSCQRLCCSVCGFMSRCWLSLDTSPALNLRPQKSMSKQHVGLRNQIFCGHLGMHGMLICSIVTLFPHWNSACGFDRDLICNFASS